MTDHPGRVSKEKIKSGSPRSGEPLSIAIGKIRRPHGLKGEVIFEPYPEYSVTLKKGVIVLIGNKKEAYTIRSIRNMDRNYLIAFDGLDDCDSISHLRNQLIYIKGSELDVLEGGKQYPHQVLGMSVVDENANPVGLLREVLITGANDVYVIVNEKEEEILLPAIDSVIIKVDPDKNTMTVHLPVWE